MALSSLGMIPQIIGGIQTGLTGTTPLEAIEARRAARAEEAIKQQEADSGSLQAHEYAMAGQSKRAAEARTQALLNNAPHITVKDPRDPMWLQQYKQLTQYLLNTGDPTLIKMGQEGLSKLTEIQKSGALDTGTQEGLRVAAGNYKDIAAAEASETYTKMQEQQPRITRPALDTGAQGAIDQAIKKYHPKYNDKVMGIPNIFSSPDDEKIISQRAHAIVERSRVPGAIEVSYDEAVQIALGQIPNPNDGQQQIPPPPGTQPNSPLGQLPNTGGQGALGQLPNTGGPIPMGGSNNGLPPGWSTP